MGVWGGSVFLSSLLIGSFVHQPVQGCFLPRCHDCVLSISTMTSTDLVSWLSADVPSQRLPGYDALIDRLKTIDAEFSFWLRNEADIIAGLGVSHDLALRIRAQAEKRKTVPSLSGCRFASMSVCDGVSG